MAQKPLADLIEEAAHIGVHKGNYGLKWYLSAEQQAEIVEALRTSDTLARYKREAEENLQRLSRGGAN